MRVAMFEDVGKPLKITKVDDPTPQAGQVVIKVGRCGICSSDLHLTEHHSPAMPSGGVPGHEFSGEIVGLGKDVTGVRVGDRVSVVPALTCGRCSACLGGRPFACEAGSRTIGIGPTWGGYAEYTVADARWCVPMPSGLSMDDGALIEPLAVGLHGVKLGPVSPGDKVLVIGAGAVGLAAAHWAKRAGARRVAVTASSNRREELAMTMGADIFVLPGEGETAAEMTQRALGGRADVVLECAGVPGMLDRAIACVRRNGVVVVLGICMQPDTISAFPAVLNEVVLKFAFAADRPEFETCLDALEAGGVEPRAMLSGTVSLDDTPTMFEHLRTAKQPCKVMIDPWA